MPCIDPIYIITRLLAPLTGLVNLTAKGILFLFGVRNNTDENDVTEEEIINMVQEGHEQGVIQASEAEMTPTFSNTETRSQVSDTSWKLSWPLMVRRN